MSKQPIEIEDILQLKLPTSVRIGGDTVVWSERQVSAIDPEKPKARRKTVANLVAVTGDGKPRPLTELGMRVDSAPRPSPDGKRVAFLRSIVGDKPEPKELCIVEVTSGEVSVLARERGQFSPPVWSPDGASIAFSFRRDDPLPEGGSAPLAIRVTRAFYKMDGQGFFPRDRARIYLVPADRQEPAPIEPASFSTTDGDWDDTEPAFSPDGSRLAFLSNRREDRDLNQDNQDVFVAELTATEPRQVTRREGLLMKLAWAPNGRWIAALGCFGPPATMLMRAQVSLIGVDAEGERAERNLTEAVDHSLMNLTIDDLWGLEEWAQPPLFVDGGARVLLPIAERGATWLASFAVNDDGTSAEAPQKVIDDAIVVATSATASADELVVLTTSALEPGIIERCAPDGSRRRRVAAPLAGYVNERAISTPREMWVTTEDGAEIQSWMLLPEGDGPFPLLLDIHGGPVVQFGTGFFHELQTFVARGYAVLCVNPRGSQGYGLAFCNAIARDWGRKPEIDLMAALDAALEAFPIDPDRLGVVGGSYGGYMTNWLIGHTDRFKTACTQRTVAQMDALIWGDYGWAWGPELGSWSWDDPEHYIDQSPLTYAKNINTPLLILQGLGDLRTPADQGERLFITLKVLGKDVEMVLFPGANHDLSRNGPVDQRIERLEVLHEWFDRTL